jgi:predicted nucleic acid-binding protein
MKIDGKAVIDTNILVYFFGTNSIFHQFARNIIDNNYHDICIVHKSISEFVSVLSKLGR